MLCYIPSDDILLALSDFILTISRLKECYYLFYDILPEYTGKY